MARRHDVDVNDIDLEEEELDTDDLEAAGCAVCALGAHRPRLPVATQVQLPASGAPVHSVTALVADAHTLQRENQELRAQYELVSAHNVGLATHASVLHDRNLAILHRAREDYRAGMIRLEQAIFSREHAELDYAVLEDRVADFRARAERADAAETLLRAERGSSTEQYRDLQAQLRAARDQVTDLTAQLARAPATPPPSTVSLARLFAAQGERDDLRIERDDLRVDLAAAQAALAPVQARLVATAEQQRDAALAERDRVTRVLMAVARERDAAVTERDRARQAVAALEQRRDAAVAERDQARQALTALEQQRALSRMEIEAAQNLNVPLQDDLRRVNALLVAHAEVLRRGATRIHELEESVATATTLRVAAESEMARAQAGELCATSRAAQYQAGWLSMRRSSQQRRGAVGAQTHRLSARVAELEEERDLAIRERDERAVAWRRMLRDARWGRELARRVCDELADRLAGVVTRVGGQIDTADLQFLWHPRFLFLLQLRRALVPGRARRLRRWARRLALPLQQVLRAPVMFRLRPLPRPRRVFGDLDTARRVVRVLSHARLGRQEWRPLRRLVLRPFDVVDGSLPWPTLRPPTTPLRRPHLQLRPLRPLQRAHERTRRASAPSLRTARTKRGELSLSAAGCIAPGLAHVTFPDIPALPFCFAFAFPLGLSFAFALASTLALPFSLALLGVDAFGRLNAFGARGGVGALGGVGGLAPVFSCTADALLVEGPCGSRSWTRHWSGRFGRLQSSASSSSRASSSSTASSGSAGSAPAAPFFDPVIPPAGTPSGWRQPRYAPWSKRVRRLRLHLITVQELRTLFLPPPGWILPHRVPPPAPANWNRALVTLANVDALYATRPWRYLAQAAEALLFASGDAAFRPFLRRLRYHIEHWAQAYWEATHELFVQGAEWKRWRTARNSRRSHAGNHLNSLLQLVAGLFQQGLADMDLLLDPMVLHFPPAHASIGLWYPGLQHATLQAALDDIDAQEPWRRVYRTPLTVAEMDAYIRCQVTRDHPACHVPRLAGKFIQQV
ncbi:hypothetical protein PHYSODRAFT_324189 [Phytophthora sojae]|uniref:Uncharacterized protein n=1 Tax=Phytophthora sojae (strain P6497) TaxID=1094619 RepID=G4YRG2_PHYSP|nr:hypothetical protein PHYSODRAFT_324189 [Phytophthora sojae]EGZ22896.1 hypothetical protein PHYSODRAFT_324189 [Phytophthora sojae]|eukprot:XP_009518184.1 hypothetical protein PHYSODRAFT_324189 [Phytophthora sojae]